MTDFNPKRPLLLICKDGSENQIDDFENLGMVLVYEFVEFQGHFYVLREDNRAVYVGHIGEIFDLEASNENIYDAFGVLRDQAKLHLREAIAHLEHSLDLLETGECGGSAPTPPECGGSQNEL